MIDDDNDAKEFDFSKLGVLKREPAPTAGTILDKLLGKEDHVNVPVEDMFTRGNVAEPMPMPCNRATMECLRGPCKHLWTQTVRIEGRGDERVMIARARQCNAFVGAADDLADENVFQCGLWWPAGLEFVPESLRPLLRPRLRRAWEWWLKRNGYDFSWKWWEDSVFETDKPEQRGQSGLGITAATFLHKQRAKPEKKAVEQPEPGTTIYNV